MHFLITLGALFLFTLDVQSIPGDWLETPWSWCGSPTSTPSDPAVRSRWLTDGCNEWTGGEVASARAEAKPYDPPDVEWNKTCVLWDPTCKGNRTEALEIFFGWHRVGIANSLTADPCFNDEVFVFASCTGTRTIPPATATQWSSIKSWMRDPEKCLSAMNDPPFSSVSVGREDVGLSEHRNCCGICGIDGPNADVYYWPVSGANYDCLSIVGTSHHPPLWGASTVNGLTCWGNDQDDCSATWAPINVEGGASYRKQLVDPWITYTTLNGLVNAVTPPPSKIAPRSRSSSFVWGTPIALINKHHEIQNETLGHSFANATLDGANSAYSGLKTVVFEGHTFTSPSIYVKFHDLTAYDNCGFLGKHPIISSTMIAFAPGELSTTIGSTAGYLNSAPAPYDFADLPCPPTSVMRKAFYSPQPGVFYQPLIAFPTRLRHIDPLWSTCTANGFVGLDPPRTLEMATAMAADPTPAIAHSDPHIDVPLPAQIHDPLPQNTGTVRLDPPPAQSITPGSHRAAGPGQDPSEKKSAPAAKHEGIDLPPNVDTSTTEILHDSKAGSASAELADSSPVPVSVIHKTLDEEMSNLRQALAPVPTAAVDPYPTMQKPEDARLDPQHLTRFSGETDDISGDQSLLKQDASISRPQLLESQVPPQGKIGKGQNDEGLQMSSQEESNGHEDANEPDDHVSQVHGLLPSQYESFSGSNDAPDSSAERHPAVILDAPKASSSSGSVRTEAENNSSLEASAPEENLNGINDANNDPLGNTPTEEQSDQIHNDAVELSSQSEAKPNTKQNSESNIPERFSSEQLNSGAGATQTIHLPSLAPQNLVSPKPATIDGHIVQSKYFGALFDSQTIRLGASFSLVSGVPVSIDSSNIIHIASSSYKLSPAIASPNPAKQHVTFLLPDGATAVALPKAGGVSIYGTTLLPGAHTNIGEKVVSMDSSSNLIYQGTEGPLARSTRNPLSMSPPISPSSKDDTSVTTVAHVAVTPLSNGIEVDGTTMSEGGPQETISGTVVSFGHSRLVVGHSSVALNLPTASTTSTGAQAIDTMTDRQSSVTSGRSAVTGNSKGMKARAPFGLWTMAICGLGQLLLLWDWT